MFASRANQENVIYEQQTAAAAKPLNQGVKGLAPKTPSNKPPKTPFKVPLNDENTAFAAGKTGGKAKQDGLFGEGKSGKVDKDAFVTPAGPRNRAPLGNKTTNAKATAFQTPAPPTQEKPSAKQSSPRMRRAKIKVHEAETITQHDDQEEPDIEYMPPREVPLPDYPDDWPHDRTYPQFEGANLTRGWWSEFAPKNDPEELSDFEEKINQLKERERREKAQQAKKSTPAKTTALQKTSRDPLTAKAPQTLKAKHAASALANTTRAPVPSFAAPTSTSQSRMPSSISSKKSTGASKTPVAPGNSRHNAARAASNSTLGYSKGRAVSGAARSSITGTKGGENPISEERKASPMKTSLDDLFPGARETGDDMDGGVPVFEVVDGLDDFQLDPVEL